jgi:hypothetical protein
MVYLMEKKCRFTHEIDAILNVKIEDVLPDLVT